MYRFNALEYDIMIYSVAYDEIKYFKNWSRGWKEQKALKCSNYRSPTNINSRWPVKHQKTEKERMGERKRNKMKERERK